jgi:hypothetical protein
MQEKGSGEDRLHKAVEAQVGADGTVYVTTNVDSDATVTGRFYRRIISNDDTTTITSITDEEDNDVTSDMGAGSQKLLAGNYLVIPTTIDANGKVFQPRIKKVVYTSTNKMIGVL